MDITDQKKRIEIFCCYARKDQSLLMDLKKHLKLWERQNLVAIWTDTDITPGTNWEKAIAQHLDAAHIILFLVSADFLASEYCWSTEMIRAMERYERGEVFVLPIILRPCDWGEAPFGKMQALPADAKPIVGPGWHNQDEALLDVVGGIRKAVEALVTAAPTITQDRLSGSVSSTSPSPISIPSQLVVLPRRNGPLRVKVGMLLLALIILIGGIGLSPLIIQYLIHLTATPTTTGSPYDAHIAADGIMFGFNAQHTGFNSYEHQLDPTNVSRLTQAWAFATGGKIFSSPVVTNGVVYFGSEDSTLYALSAISGDLLWQAYTGASIDSSPAVVGGVVYVGSGDGKLYAFKASTGMTLWTATTGRGIGSSPVVVNGKVYIGSDDGKLYAFSAAGCGQGQMSCMPLWTAQTAGAIESSPAVDNKMVYIGSNDGKVYAFSTSECGQGQVSCSPLWTAPIGIGTPDYSTNNSGSPVVANDVVYIGSSNANLYAFNASTGTLLWRAMNQFYIGTTPAVVNGIVYLGSGDHELHAYRALGCGHTICSPLWSAFTGDAIDSSPRVANGVVYVGSADKSLYAFNASGCVQEQCLPLWKGFTKDQVESSPTVANGVVYVGSSDNQLYAFHLSGATS